MFERGIYGIGNWVVKYLGPIIKALWKCGATIVVGIIIILATLLFITDYIFTTEYRKTTIQKPDQYYDYTDDTTKSVLGK